MKKEEFAIVLDFLPYGYPLEKKMMPIAQAAGTNYITLLQLVPRRGIKLEVGEEVYIGEGKRDKIQYIMGRCPPEKLTENAKIQLEDFISKKVLNEEEKFVKFFNEAQSVNTRLHQLELLPGFGKKHMKAVIEARQEKPFESFEDIRKRIPNLPDPVKTIERRIMEEVTGNARHRLFL